MSDQLSDNKRDPTIRDSKAGSLQAETTDSNPMGQHRLPVTNQGKVRRKATVKAKATAIQARAWEHRKLELVEVQEWTNLVQCL